MTFRADSRFLVQDRLFVQSRVNGLKGNITQGYRTSQLPLRGIPWRGTFASEGDTIAHIRTALLRNGCSIHVNPPRASLRRRRQPADRRRPGSRNWRCRSPALRPQKRFFRLRCLARPHPHPASKPLWGPVARQNPFSAPRQPCTGRDHRRNTPSQNVVQDRVPARLA